MKPSHGAALLTVVVVAGCASSSTAARSDGAAVSSAPTRCFGVSEAELRASPLESLPILAVRRLRAPMPPKGILTQPAGAEIYLLASSEQSREALGHRIACHAARMAGTRPARPDPLAIGSAKVDVTSTSNGFVVAITSKDVDDAERILRESQDLLDATSASAEQASR
jgi:hypothetical protein